jgi:hypothetical protein
VEKRELDAVYARLEQLERENRRFRMAGIYIVVGLIAIGVMGAKFVRNRGTVEAERFVLKDRQGTVRGALAIERDGSPGLSLLDRQGRQLLSVRAYMDDTAEVSLYSKGDARLMMFATSTGAATLNFLDPKHGAASGLYIKPDGNLGLEFRSDRRALGLTVAPDGAAKIAFKDAAGKSLGGMEVKPDGTTEVGLAEEPEKHAEQTVATETTREVPETDADAVRPVLHSPPSSSRSRSWHGTNPASTERTSYRDDGGHSRARQSSLIGYTH